MNLYWVETEDHHEDWLIIAQNKRQAERIHEEVGDYAPGMATAIFILRIPGQLEPVRGYPKHQLLEACGAKILRPQQPRVVEINGVRYVERMMDDVLDDSSERRGLGRPNRTGPQRLN